MECIEYSLVQAAVIRQRLEYYVMTVDDGNIRMFICPYGYWQETPGDSFLAKLIRESRMAKKMQPIVVSKV